MHFLISKRKDVRRIATFATQQLAEKDARKYDHARVTFSGLKPLVVKLNDDGTWSVWNPGNAARPPRERLT